MKYETVGVLACLLALLPSLSAQSSRILVAEGDAIPGVGDLASVGELEINDLKSWRIQAITRALDPTQNEALYQDGRVQVREGMSLLSPTGAILITMDSIALNDHGDIALAARIRRAPPQPTTLVEALVWNLRTLAVEPDPIPFTSPLLPAGSRYDTFDFVKVADRNTLISVGSVVSPVAPQRRDAVIQFRLDDLGNVQSTSLLAVRYQPVPGIPGAVLGSVGNAEASFDVNGRAQTISFAITNFGNAVLLDMDQPLAREGFASPVGRNWSSLLETKVALNDAGDYVLTGMLEGTTDRYLIEKSGQKFAQEGDVLPALSPTPLAGGSAVPIRLANNGDVFWHARVQGGLDEAFMRNYEPIVRPGDFVDGRKVARLDTSADAFTISQDGRFFLCNVEFADDVDAAVLFDFGLALALPGCTGNPGELALAAGQVRVGQTMALAMDDGHIAGALARIDFALKPRNPGSSCGVVTAAGEVLISIPSIVASVNLPPWDGTNPTSVALAIPNDVALVDRVLFAQGTFRTPGAAQRSLTNALRLEIGAL